MVQAIFAGARCPDRYARLLYRGPQGGDMRYDARRANDPLTPAAPGAHDFRGAAVSKLPSSHILAIAQAAVSCALVIGRRWLSVAASIAVVVVVAGCLGPVAQASAYIYWASDNNTIGRANLAPTPTTTRSGAPTSRAPAPTSASSPAPTAPPASQSTPSTSTGPTSTATRSGAPPSTAPPPTSASSPAPTARTRWRSTPRTSTGPTSTATRSGAPPSTAPAPPSASSPARARSRWRSTPARSRPRHGRDAFPPGYRQQRVERSS